MSEGAHDDPLAAIDLRDPALIRAMLPTLELLLSRYHEVDLQGFERVPEGAALVVGNHNGGTLAPDMFALMAAWWRRFGADAPAYGLMHDLAYRVPVIGPTMARFGAVPGHPRTALTLLERGAKVLVYPGGDLDAFRPSSQRHRVIFGERLGFIKVALRSGAPVVPVVSAGAHDAFHVITDGTEIARRIGWKRLTRIEVFPVVIGLPFGLMAGPVFAYLPLPVRMKIRVLDPIRFEDTGPAAAADEVVVRRARDRVLSVMQTALDELMAEGDFGRRWPAFLRRR